MRNKLAQSPIDILRDLNYLRGEIRHLGEKDTWKLSLHIEREVIYTTLG